MLTNCPICGERLVYAGPLHLVASIDNGPDHEVVFCENDSYCLHCSYRFDPVETEYQMTLGEYAYGDPYQLRAALEQGQLSLL